MFWLNNSPDTTGTPCYVLTGIVRDPHGNIQCFSYHMGPVRVPCVTHDTSRMGKIPAPASYLAARGPYGPLTVHARAVHGLFTISKPVRDRKLIMHALKLYEPRMGRQHSYGAGTSEWTYGLCSKQPVHSPGTARTGSGSVMWLRHKAELISGD